MINTHEDNHVSAVADPSDRATMLEMHYAQDSLAEVQRRSVPRTSASFDGENCIDCEQAIDPPGRIALGYQVCTHCQSALDKKFKFRH